MQVNLEKYTISISVIPDTNQDYYITLFPFHILEWDGLKYLGFLLKPNDYQKQDWSRLFQKVKKRLNFMVTGINVGSHMGIVY